MVRQDGPGTRDGVPEGAARFIMDEHTWSTRPDTTTGTPDAVMYRTFPAAPGTRTAWPRDVAIRDER